MASGAQRYRVARERGLLLGTHLGETLVKDVSRHAAGCQILSCIGPMIVIPPKEHQLGLIGFKGWPQIQIRNSNAAADIVSYPGETQPVILGKTL
jgi:hypothetical protein